MYIFIVITELVTFLIIAKTICLLVLIVYHTQQYDCGLLIIEFIPDKNSEIMKKAKTTYFPE